MAMDNLRERKADDLKLPDNAAACREGVPSLLPE